MLLKSVSDPEMEYVKTDVTSDNIDFTQNILEIFFSCLQAEPSWSLS